MYLQWHPDRYAHNAIATEIFQFLLHQIHQFEKNITPEEKIEPVVRTPCTSRYKTWNITIKKNSEARRKSGNQSSFPVVRPQSLPGNAQVWITQAEGDLEALFILRKSKAERVSANICFLAHEVAEKSLKAGMYAVCGLNQSDLKVHHRITNYADSLHYERPDQTNGLIEHVRAVTNFYNRTRWPNQYTPHQAPMDHYSHTDAETAEENAKAIFRMMKALVDHKN